MSQKMLLAGMMVLVLSLSAHAQNYGAGSCNFPNVKQTFPTIQGAVNAVPPGSTVFVCPGVYPEQVTITKPLTLQGRAFGNGNRATITMVPVPGGNYSPNAQNAYAQILVENVNPPGPVNITGITVDGSTDATQVPQCMFVSPYVGIFYTSGTTGTVNEVTLRNQKTSSYCGYGTWADNEIAGPNQPITIENSSVHDFDNSGIVILGYFSATLHANFLAGGDVLLGSPAEIAIEFADASITNNLVAKVMHGTSLFLYNNGSVNVSENTVADAPIGLWNVQDTPLSVPALTIQSNRIFNVQTAFSLVNGDGAGYGAPFGPTIQGNLFQNANIGIDFNFGVNCPAGTTVDGNKFNDLQVALNNAPPPLIGSNQFANVDTIKVPGTCQSSQN